MELERTLNDIKRRRDNAASKLRESERLVRATEEKVKRMEDELRRLETDYERVRERTAGELEGHKQALEKLLASKTSLTHEVEMLEQEIEITGRSIQSDQLRKR